VTVGQYAKFLESTSRKAPPEWKIMNQPSHQQHPVVMMDWSDANRYCHWAEKRLPTEAEWEKAARGTDGRIYPWGNDLPTPLRANYGKKNWDKHAALVPVGTLEDGKSPYGIYDMAGNAWEWVSDWYDNVYYKNSPSQNPKGPERGDFKVLRAARGTVGRSPSIPRIGTTAHRSTAGAPTTGFGARKLRSLWSFDPWVLVLRPKDSEIPRSHEEAGEPSRVNRRR
jgi:formylglycine-generating enzyme required for sulfatase activity